MTRSTAFLAVFLLLAFIVIVVGGQALSQQQGLRLEVKSELEAELEAAQHQLAVQEARHRRDFTALDATYADLMLQVACLEEELLWYEGYIPTLPMSIIAIEDIRTRCYEEERR